MGCWSLFLKNICKGTGEDNLKSHAVQHFRRWIFTSSTQSGLGNGKRKRRVRNILGMISTLRRLMIDRCEWGRSQRGRSEEGREGGSEGSLVIACGVTLTREAMDFLGFRQPMMVEIYFLPPHTLKHKKKKNRRVKTLPSLLSESGLAGAGEWNARVVSNLNTGRASYWRAGWLFGKYKREHFGFFLIWEGARVQCKGRVSGKGSE